MWADLLWLIFSLHLANYLGISSISVTSQIHVVSSWLRHWVFVRVCLLLCRAQGRAKLTRYSVLRFGVLRVITCHRDLSWKTSIMALFWCHSEIIFDVYKMSILEWISFNFNLTLTCFPSSRSLCCCNFPLKHSTLALFALQLSGPAFSQVIL